MANVYNKSFPFPVLSPDGMDYQEGLYEAKVYRANKKVASVEVAHKLNDGHIVSQRIKSGKAKFACIVSLPTTMHRRLHLSEGGKLELHQLISYDNSNYAETYVNGTPMFRPMIVETEGFSFTADETTGLDGIWLNQKIDVPQGAIVAYANWEGFKGEAQSILNLQKAKEEDGLGEWQMRVSVSFLNGFQFNVLLGGKLFYAIKENAVGSEEHCRSVLTHALSSGFVYLQAEKGKKGDDGQNEYWWQNHINLRQVAQRLEQEGLPNWEQDDFCPEQVATSFYPHIIKKIRNAEEGEDD